MSRKLRIAPAPTAGFLFQNLNGQQFIITQSCVSRMDPPLAEDEIDALEAAPFDISLQGTLENAIQNAPNVMRLPEEEGEMNAIMEEVIEAMGNFE